MFGNIRRFFNTTKAKQRRYDVFTQLVMLKADDCVIHIGCGHGYSFEYYNKENEVVGVDLESSCDIQRERFTYYQADGEDLSMFKDKEFDVAISVGTLEHIHPYEKLERMAHEMRRVAKRYVVIIPHYWTIIEPHFQMPFWQFYPHFLKSLLVKYFRVGNYPKLPDGNYERLNYFRKSGWKKLFPDANIHTHRHILGGVVKNFIIYKSID